MASPSLSLALLLVASEQHVDLVRQPSLPVLVTGHSRTASIASTMLVKALQSRVAEQAVAVQGDWVGFCSGRLSCITSTVFGDYPSARSLVIAAVFGSAEQGITIEATIINLERARESLSASTEGDDRDLRLVRDAITARVRSPTLAFGSQEEMLRFADSLAQHARWKPPGGKLHIDGLPSGAVISLDGVVVATSLGGRLLLQGVPSGSRHIQVYVEHSSDSASLSILERQVTTWTPNLTKDPSPLAMLSNVGWVGVGASALGVAMFTAAWARHDGERSLVCLELDAQERCGRPLLDLGASDSRFDRETGFPLTPLAAGLTVSGLTWILASHLLRNHEMEPWLSLGAGLVSGIATSSGLMIWQGNAVADTGR